MRASTSVELIPHPQICVILDSAPSFCLAHEGPDVIIPLRMVKVRVYIPALCVSLVAALLGCGGSGGGAPGAKVIVVWPDRTREVNAPKSANFASLTLWNDLIPVTGPRVARGSNILTHLSKLQTPAGVGEGSHRATVQFYANAFDAIPVAIAEFPTFVDAHGNVFNPDKTHLGPVNFASRIATLTPTIPGSMFSSAATVATLSARDINGNVVSFDPSALHIVSQTGPGQLQLNTDNRLSVVQPGFDTVQFSVDGVTSTSVDVDCFASVNLNLNPVWMSAASSTTQLWAITAAPDNRLLQIDAASGTVVNRVALGQACTFARISADQTIAYVAVNGVNKVLRVDLKTNVVTKTITVNSPAGLVNPEVVDLAIQPANNDNFIVTFKSAGIVFGQGTLMLNGVIAPGYQPTYGLVHPYWIDNANVLMGSEGSTLAAAFKVDMSGFGALTKVASVTTGAISYFNGKLYAQTGYLLDYVSLATIGVLRDDSPGVLLDIRPDLDRSLFSDPNALPLRSYLVYTMTYPLPTVRKRFAVDALVLAPAGLSAPTTPKPVLVGTDSVAIADGRSLYIVRGVAK